MKVARTPVGNEWLRTASREEKAGVLLPEQVSCAFMHDGVILSVPVTFGPREVALALSELWELWAEDYLRRRADSGGT